MGDGRQNVQLLKIAVCNVVAAPVWNSIELNAVGEFHLVLCLKPLSFLPSFILPSLVFIVGVVVRGDVTVINKFVFVVGGQG